MNIINIRFNIKYTSYHVHIGHIGQVVWSGIGIGQKVTDI